MKLKWYVFLISTMFLSQNSVMAQHYPEWVQQRPVSKLFYIGIGSAVKDTMHADYQQAAKEQALQDLSSEINVKVSAEVLQTITETSGIIEDDLRSQVRSSTQASLDGYEMVDAWEDETEYWVYYRLSKQLYKEQVAERRATAQALAKDFYLKGRQKEKQSDAAGALRFYLQSLAAIQEFLMQAPIQVQLESEKVFLQNELVLRLQDVLNAVQLTPQKFRLKGKAGQALADPLVVQVSYRNQTGQNQSQPGFPLAYKFTKGSGDLNKQVQTDSTGKGICRVTKLGSAEKLQLISVQPDLEFMQPEQINALALVIVKNLAVPQNRFMIDVASLTIFIDAQEKNLGRDLDLLLIEPHLKSALAEQGYLFVDDPGQADVMIELKAQSRKGAQVYSLYSAFVDLSVSLLDLKTGNELYKKIFHDIKGIQLDFEKAGIKALQNAGEKMEQFIPEIIKPLQK